MFAALTLVLAMGGVDAIAGAAVQGSAEVVAEIRVHGNVATSDDEVKRLAAIEIGAAVTPATVADVAERLRGAKRFRRVEVLKRFASIADPTQIVLVIVVDEGPVTIEMTGDPANPTRVVKSRRLNLLFLPILDAEDGSATACDSRTPIRSANTAACRSRSRGAATRRAPWSSTRNSPAVC
jgi:hypothetical protein